MEKQRGLTGKKYLIGALLIILFLFISLNFVSGAITVNLPLNNTNFTGAFGSLVSFNVSYLNGTDFTSATNATFYYNLSGVWTIIGSTIVCKPAAAGLAASCNATLNISGLTDGRYSINATLSNTTSGFNNATSTGTTIISNSGARSISQNVIFDKTPPNVSSTLVGVVNYGNYTGTLTLNISVDDAVVGMNYVYFNITYSNGSQVNYSQATASGGYYSISINTATFTDGFYNLTIYANDSLNNINTSTKLFLTFDNTAPTGSISCSPLDLYKGDTITCTCSGSDALSGISSGTGSSNPSTSQTGSFIGTCIITDYAGNSITVLSEEYIVNLRPSSRVLPRSNVTTPTNNQTSSGEAVADTIPGSTTIDSETNPQTTGEEKQQAGMILGMPYWIWVIIAVTVLLVILGRKFLFNNKKKRK